MQLSDNLDWYKDVDKLYENILLDVIVYEIVETSERGLIFL
ncbi:hypothetical protein CEAHHEIO_00214 [Monkeypox virus]|uniref:Uncharacterized protein n=1 Tax=Monkeypox virus TaxID=10244 RepID=A0A650BUG3_MONPV|nr:hypothetical protein PDLMKLCO_00001 [Monkeypox virus]QGQ59933.1 hypothetical protein PDLMKLCO_00213 [Monkeypox virus]URK21058.1 hypothetical protein MPXV-SI-2022V502225_00001 [Monkeypox virus]URK21271.1 hypothetical protein MPXV-SI-2022V502225_00215 [Monkeypox virus]URK21273.1 hypothetical protein MPXV-SI-2022V52144_00001 [Monkeypox virus]